MLFSDALKDVPVGVEAVPGVLLRTNRLYSCDVCKTLTGFRYIRDTYETPCCSDECLDEMDGANSKEPDVLQDSQGVDQGAKGKHVKDVPGSGEES